MQFLTSREREVVVPYFNHHCGELRLASHKAWFLNRQRMIQEKKPLELPPCKAQNHALHVTTVQHFRKWSSNSSS